MNSSGISLHYLVLVIGALVALLILMLLVLGWQEALIDSVKTMG